MKRNLSMKCQIDEAACEVLTKIMMTTNSAEIKTDAAFKILCNESVCYQELFDIQVTVMINIT